jgi:N-acetylmuramoyl-L-alanine amidase
MPYTLTKFALVTVLVAAPTLPLQGQDASQVILIDAGHGGSDVGARAPTGTLEKDITLTLARQLEAALLDLGAPVEMTRRTDSTVSLEDRADGADNAALFLSIHTGGAPTASHSGMQIYIPPNSAASRTVANLLAEHLQSVGAMRVRPIEEVNFAVFRDLSSPGVMIEPGFLTNPDDTEFMRDPDVQRRLTKAVVAALQSGGFVPASP